MDPRRAIILNLATVLADPASSVSLQRGAVIQLERLVLAEKEYLDRPITATECRASMKSYFNENDFNWQCQRHLDVAKHGSPADRSSALFDLEKLLTDTRVDRQRVEQEKKLSQLTLGFVEDTLETFMKDRKAYRDRCSTGGPRGSDQYDQDFSCLFRDFLRYKLKSFPV